MFTRYLNCLRQFVITRVTFRVGSNKPSINLFNNKRCIRLKTLKMTDNIKKESDDYIDFSQKYKLSRKVQADPTKIVVSSINNNDHTKVVQEDKSPYAKFRGSKVLYVTDFASLAWCEMQQHYALITGGKKETRAMKAGSEIHTALELQVHDI